MRSSAQAPEAGSRLLWLLWVWPFAVLAWVTLVLAPRFGADWTSDDGFFLARSWGAAHGFGLDRTYVPQDPCYLFNALWMRLGVAGLLAFRRISYIFNFTAAGAFFLALDRRRLRSPAVPLALSASLLVTLTSVSTPSSLSFGFFMLGAACLCLYFDAQAGGGRRWPVLGAVFFALAGFMHALVAPAMLLVVLALLGGVPGLRRGKHFLGAFALASAALWVPYVHAVGWAALLASPEGHDAGAGHLFAGCVHLARHFGEPLAAFAALACLLFPLGKRRFFAAQAFLSLLVALYYGWALACGLAALPEPDLAGGLHGVLYFLKQDSLYVSRIPGAAAYLLYFAMFRFWAEAWAGDALESGGFAAGGWPARAAQILWGSPQRRKRTLAFLGFEAVNCALAVGSASDVFQVFAFSGGLMVGLVIVLDGTDFSGSVPAWGAYAAPCVWLGLLLAFTGAYNHCGGDAFFEPGRSLAAEGPLRGLWLSPRYQGALGSLEAAYGANHGRDLPLVPLENFTLLYFLLERPLPDYGTRPALFFSEKAIRGELSLAKGWCVIDATTRETRDYVRIKGADAREPLRRWVRANSDRAVPIPSPSDGIGDLTLYFRSPRV